MSTQNVPCFGNDALKKYRGRPLTEGKDWYLSCYYNITQNTVIKEWIEGVLLKKEYVIKDGKMMSKAECNRLDAINKARARMRIAVRNLDGYVLVDPVIKHHCLQYYIDLPDIRTTLVFKQDAIERNPLTGSLMYVVKGKKYHYSRYDIRITGLDTTAVSDCFGFVSYLITDFVLEKK